MKKSFALLSFSATLLVVAGFALHAFATESKVDWKAGHFAGTEEEVHKLIEIYEAIDLTPEQEAIRLAALEPMPAPCCGNFSAATCCCECNLSRSIWGLSKYLITEEGADAEMVRGSVEKLIATLNPDGYSGEVCTKGGCLRTFENDGCGGMAAHDVRY